MNVSTPPTRYLFNILFSDGLVELFGLGYFAFYPLFFSSCSFLFCLMSRLSHEELVELFVSDDGPFLFPVLPCPSLVARFSFPLSSVRVIACFHYALLLLHGALFRSAYLHPPSLPPSSESLTPSFPHSVLYSSPHIAAHTVPVLA